MFEKREREQFMHSKLMSHRFDPPGGWRWKCRFSVDELKTIYSKLFGFNWFRSSPNRALKPLETFDVGERKDAYCSYYGKVRLEDGGMKNLEFCTIEELDWFLFVGTSFGVTDSRVSWIYMCENLIVNPLHSKLGREEAMIALDLLPEKLGVEFLTDESMSHVNARQLV